MSERRQSREPGRRRPRPIEDESWKIDRSFVSELDRLPTARKLVESIIGLGHRLSLEVVAEGVETEAQQGFLVSHGCDRLQGYLLSKPLSAQDISLQLGSAGLEQADTESASATAARR